MKLNTTTEIIKDIKNGKLVIIMDDKNRENEGDLIMAASLTNTECINFMATEGRGLICLTLTEQRCKQLSLPLMVDNNRDSNGTNFTVSIEAATGVTTGISAADRATTILSAVKTDAAAADIVQPGHIFPLMAKKGGVLNRAGHTEAGCDLAKLAGLEPAAVIVEILNQDGSMARAPDLIKFAHKHNLKIGTIEDLIKYKISHEKTINRVADTEFLTKYGKYRLFAFNDTIEDGVHLALVKGDISADKPTAVRVHMENILCDLFHPVQNCSWPLTDVMQKMQNYQSAVIVILRKKEDDQHIINLIENYQEKIDKEEVKSHTNHKQDIRTIGIGAQILTSLGVKKMQLLSAPKTFHALAGFGLEVVDFIEN